jgi:hypothetical protein
LLGIVDDLEADIGDLCHQRVKRSVDPCSWQEKLGDLEVDIEDLDHQQGKQSVVPYS